MLPIRQVDLAAALTPVPLPTGTSRCLLIFRWRDRVVGRRVVDVAGDAIAVDRLTALARETAPETALDAWCDDYLGHDRRALLGTTAPTVTVAICTRERPEDLDRALSAVAALSPRPLEVLVIDNAPTTDRTHALVAGYPGTRYIREDRRGLDAARNRALREARGDIVAFSDDDAAPEPRWLAGLVPNFADPRVVVVTGITLPLELETEGQELFEEHCSFVKGFSRRVFDGQTDHPLAVGPVGAGANMAVRRHALLQLGGFDERLDGGMPTRSGGDHEMYARVLMAGHRIVYDPSAVSWHRHRRTKEELLDTVYGYGVGVYAMWTGFLVERRELGIFRLAWQWLTQGQLRQLRHHDPVARQIAWHELKGCVRGPQAWFAANRLSR